jgi:hypothetical protein
VSARSLKLLRAEALAAAANADTILPTIPVSASLLDSFEHATLEQNTTANVKSTPCLTGPRGSPESFVLVDSAQEALCYGIEHSLGSGDHSVTVSASRPDKSLTRKVSAPRRGQAALNGAAVRSGRGHGDEDGTQASYLRGNIDGGDRRERERLLSLHKGKRKSDSLRLSLKAPLLSSDAEDSSGRRAGHPPQGPSAPNSTDVLVQAPSESRSRDGGTDTGYSGDGGDGGMSHCIDSSDVSPQSDCQWSTAAHLPSGIHLSLQGSGASPCDSAKVCRGPTKSMPGKTPGVPF